MEQWKKCKIRDIVEVNAAQYTSKDNWEKALYLDTGNITENKIDEMQEFDCSSLPSRARRKVKHGDIIFSTVRPNQKHYGYITNPVPNLLVSTGFAVISVNQELANSKFIYYWLSQDEIVEYLHNIAEQSVSAYPSIKASDICNLEIKLPPLEYQSKVASILSTLENKISLNHRINRNLEQQAQTLFKAWFVENPNPQWLDGRLSDIASFVGGYSYKGNELVDFSNIGMVTIKNYERSGGFKTDGFKDINPSPKVKSTQYAELFDILVAHTDLTQNADVIGNAELLLSFDHYKHIIFSMDLVKVLPNKNFPYRFLLAAMLKNRIFKSHCLSYVNGTTVLHLSKKALPEYEITIPTDKEAKRMNDILGCYYKQMAEILRENDILENLRNTILPKLMSGKLKINDLNR